MSLHSSLQFLICSMIVLSGMSACVKKISQTKISSTPDLIEAKPQILRAKELYLKNDYQSYVNQLIHPAVDRALAVLQNFKQRHAKIPMTSWNTERVKEILADLKSLEGKILVKSDKVRSSFSEFFDLIQSELARSGDGSSNQAKRNKYAAMALSDTLIVELRLLNKNLKRDGSKANPDARTLNEILGRLRALIIWIQLLNVSSDEMLNRITAAEAKLASLKSQALPKSSQIHFAFKAALCEFVFSSARLYVSGVDKNSKLKMLEYQIAFCDRKQVADDDFFDQKAVAVLRIEWLLSPDYAAPGVNILSTIPGGRYSLRSSESKSAFGTICSISKTFSRSFKLKTLIFPFTTLD